MTRICRRVSRTKYYGKSSYEYVTLWLYLPKKFHETLKPHVSQKLDINVEKRNGKIHITLSPKSQLRTPPKRFCSQKTTSRNR